MYQGPTVHVCIVRDTGRSQLQQHDLLHKCHGDTALGLTASSEDGRHTAAGSHSLTQLQLVGSGFCAATERIGKHLNLRAGGDNTLVNHSSCTVVASLLIIPGFSMRPVMSRPCTGV